MCRIFLFCAAAMLVALVAVPAVAASAISIPQIRYDAPGNDHENLNGEYVVFKNNTNRTVSMGGWTVRDEANHRYVFPKGFKLGAGKTVKLYTGSGRNTAARLYWGSKRAIWNNDGDTAFLRNAKGQLVVKRSY
jgi:competence protein ComEC